MLRIVLVLGFAGVTAFTATARAAPAPEPAAIAALNEAVSRASLVRVTGGFGEHRLRDLRFDATGLAFARWGEGSGARPAILVGPGVAPPARPESIPWREIVRVETGRHRALPVGIAGAMIGAGLGAAVVQMASIEGNVENPGIVIGLPALALGGIGALIGRGSYGWTTVYPAPGP